MKYQTIMLFISLFGVQPVMAQFCDPEPNNSSDFDWQADSWTVWVKPSLTQNAQLITVPSPYHPNSISSQPNTAFLEAATGEGDYSPQDGWVLLAESMGVDKPTYGVLDNEVVTRWPQFVLYNKHESKLRYFAYATDISGINDLEILTGFTNLNENEDFGTAAFEHEFTPMHSIEGFQPTAMPITTPNEFYNNSGIWLVADIPIAYDPCTCLYPSRLKIATSSTDYLTINLTLDGGGIINQVIEEGTTTNAGNFFSNIAGGITGGISKGNSAFKSASSFASQANKILVKRANERMTQEIRDNLIAEGFTNQELTLSDVEELWELQQGGNVSPPLLSAINGLFPESVSSVVPDWISELVPFGSSAVAILDFLIGGGKKKEPKPMQFQADFNFVGTADSDDTDPQVSVDFQTPGSKSIDGGPEVRIPVYNSIMGIMNLVETPVLYRASRNRSEYIDTHYEQFWYNTHEYSYKLAQPIRYAINPAAGLQLVELRTALDFRSCAPHQNPITGTEDDVPDGLNSDWTTPMMSMSCMEDYSLEFLTSTQTQMEEVHYTENCNNVYLKVVAVFQPSDPAADEVIYDALYNVDIQDAPYTYTTTPPNPYLDVPNSVEVDNIQDLLNSELTAWGDITVNQSFIATQGILDLIDQLNDNQPVGTIVVESSHPDGVAHVQRLERKSWAVGTEVLPPIVFSNPPDCGENDPVGEEWLSSFCSDLNKYYPILALANEDEEITEEENESLRGFQVFPNPATDEIRVRFELSGVSKVTIRLMDLSGREIARSQSEDWLNPGKYQDMVSIAHLLPGMYLLVLEHEGGRELSKFVKQ